jgi:threonine/homoserine/homoserine lactone efflux protein
MAVGVALSPIAIVGLIIMLGTPRARTNGPAFAAGWTLALALVGGLMLAASSGNATGEAGGPATWVGVLKVVIGVIFLLLGLRTWERRPRPGHEVPPPAWMATIDTFRPGKAFAFGLLLAGVNPKNLALTVAAGAALAELDLSSGQAAIALAVFVVLGSLTIILPVLAYLVMGERAASLLDEMKTWMQEHNAAIMLVLFLVLGAKLIGDGISSL